MRRYSLKKSIVKSSVEKLFMLYSEANGTSLRHWYEIQAFQTKYSYIIHKTILNPKINAKAKFPMLTII